MASHEVSLLLNTEDALPYVGKAVEGAILGSYSFDRYKREKAEFDKVHFNIVALKTNDSQNRQLPFAVHPRFGGRQRSARHD